MVKTWRKCFENVGKCSDIDSISEPRLLSGPRGSCAWCLLSCCLPGWCLLGSFLHTWCLPGWCLLGCCLLARCLLAWCPLFWWLFLAPPWMVPSWLLLSCLVLSLLVPSSLVPSSLVPPSLGSLSKLRLLCLRWWRLWLSGLCESEQDNRILTTFTQHSLLGTYHCLSANSSPRACRFIDTLRHCSVSPRVTCLLPTAQTSLGWTTGSAASGT